MLNLKQATDEGKALCNLVKDQKPKPGTMLLHLLYVDYQQKDFRADQTEIPGSFRFQVFRCLPRKGDVVDPAIAATTPQCSATLARALAPFRAAIDDILANDAKRRAEAIADAAARGAPYEAYWRAWQKQVAARLSAGR